MELGLVCIVVTDQTNDSMFNVMLSLSMWKTLQDTHVRLVVKPSRIGKYFSITCTSIGRVLYEIIY